MSDTPGRALVPSPRQGLNLVLSIFLLLLTFGVAAQGVSVYPGLLFTELVLLLGPVLLACRYLGLPVRSSLMLAPGAPGTGRAAAGIGVLAFTMALALTLPVLIMVVMAGGVYPGLPLELETWSQFLAALLAGAVAAPLCEELLFRGFLLRSLSSFGPHAAVWVSAVLFGLFHMDPVRFVPTMALGVVYGYLAAGTGSVRGAILAHAVNNGLALSLAFTGNRGPAKEAGVLTLESLRQDAGRALTEQGRALPAGFSVDSLLVAAAALLLVAGLVLVFLTGLALCAIAGVPGERWRILTQEEGRYQPLRRIFLLPGFWGTGVLGLVLFLLGLSSIFAPPA